MLARRPDVLGWRVVEIARVGVAEHSQQRFLLLVEAM
jgi:hypothetical protein